MNESDTLQRKALARARQRADDFQKRITAGEKAVTSLKKKGIALDKDISDTKIMIVKGNAEIKKLRQAQPDLEAQGDELDIQLSHFEGETAAIRAELDYIKSQPGLLDASGRLQPVKMAAAKDPGLQEVAEKFKVNSFLQHAQDQKDAKKTVPMIISQLTRLLSEADDAESAADRNLADKMNAEKEYVELREQNQLLGRRLGRFQTFKTSYCVRFLSILLDCGKTHLRLDGLHYEDSILPALVNEIRLRPGQEGQIQSLNLSNNMLTDACVSSLCDMLDLLAYLETLDLRGNRFTSATYVALHEKLASDPGITKVLEHQDRLEAHSGNRLRIRIYIGKQKCKAITNNSGASANTNMNFDEMCRKTPDKSSSSSALPAIAGALPAPAGSKKSRQQEAELERAMQREVSKELETISREKEAAARRPVPAPVRRPSSAPMGHGGRTFGFRQTALEFKLPNI